MDEHHLLDVCSHCADAVTKALAGLTNWGPAGTRSGQYRSDLVADEAAVAVLVGAGLGVLSEESGLHHPGRPLLAVLDPLDGSTNASHRLPWYATSICVLDAEGPLVALVVNQASGTRYEAVRGGGARRDGAAIAPSGQAELRRSFVGLSGYPGHYLGWRQFRALGACALDLCAVAEGVLDAYLDCSRSAHGPWDYLAGMLVCTEAGAAFAEVHGEELVARDHEARRAPAAAATPDLLAALLEAFATGRPPERPGGAAQGGPR